MDHSPRRGVMAAPLRRLCGTNGDMAIASYRPSKDRTRSAAHSWPRYWNGHDLDAPVRLAPPIAEGAHDVD